MKKLVLLVGLIMVLAMALAACGQGEEEGTLEPGVTDVFEETPFGTAEVTDTVLETPMETATLEPTMEVTEAPTVAATSPVMTPTQATTDTVPLPGTGGVDPNRLSNMIDFEVVSQDGDEIGDVNDMVIHLREARVIYVVVDIGGFLGIGQRQIAVPWDQLTLMSGADEATGAEGQNVFVLNGDQQMLENAPEIDLNAIPGVDEPVEGWDAEFDDYWTTGGMTNTTTTQTPGAVGSDTSTTTPEAGAGSVITGTAQAPGAIEDMQDNRLSQLILASELLDRDISLEAQGSSLEDTGTTIGTGTMTDTQGTGMETTDVQLIVRDAIIDPSDGTIQYFIVAASGLGDDDMWVPIPPDLLVEDDGDNMRFTAINPEALAGVPAFTEDEFPNTTVEGWDDALVDWWNTHMDLTTP